MGESQNMLNERTWGRWGGGARGEAYVLDGAIYIKFWEMQINLQ